MLPMPLEAWCSQVGGFEPMQSGSLLRHLLHGALMASSMMLTEQVYRFHKPKVDQG